MAKYFVTNIGKNADTISNLDKINLVKRIQESEFTFKYFMELLEDYHRFNYGKTYGLTLVLLAHKSSLVVPETFYFHSYLQVTPPPPKLKQDEITGEFEPVNQERFFLRNLRVFTIENLCDYYHQQMGSKTRIKARDEQGMYTLLASCNHDLDLCMFTIDYGISIFQERGKRNLPSPSYLVDYIDDAEDMLNQRIDTCTRADLDHEYE